MHDGYLDIDDSSLREQLEATAASWRAPYLGDFHHIFAETIREAKRLAKGASYKNIIPVVQSSGTGKSRLMHEVAGLIVTLPMNIRPPEHQNAYPFTDERAHYYLRDGSFSWLYAKNRYLAFFTSLIDIASEYLTTFSPGTVYEDETQLARDWRDYLDSNDSRARGQFYDRVVNAANRLIMEVKAYSTCPGEQRTALDAIKARSAGPRKLVQAIASRLAGDLKNSDVAVFVYIDEVHKISTIKIQGTPSKSLYGVLLDTWNELGPAHPIFLATITTSPSIIRPLNCELPYQAPYTESVFDYFPDGLVFKPGNMTLKDVATPAYMVKFGRPLFWTRWKAAEDLNLGPVFDNIRDFAFLKLMLCRRDAFDEPERFGHPRTRLLAPICTRALVEFDRPNIRARELEEGMIEANMRILYSVPMHNEYIWSGIPSEPILAEAAAMVMQKCKYDAVKVLADVVRSGSEVKHGPDLAVRLLLISAYDRAVARLHADQPYLRNKIYSIAVPLLDFLGELFSDQWYDVLKNCTARGSSMPLHEAFATAFVRFTHFVEYDGNHILDVQTALAGVARGFASQLSPAQPGVDIAVPIVMEDRALNKELMTFLLIQVKTKYEATHRPSMFGLAEMFPCTTNSHPVIHLVMQLEPGIHVPSAEPEDDTSSGRPLYRLTAYGCAPEVYGVVDDAHQDAYAVLSKLETLASEHIRQDEKYVTCVRRMKGEWDRGPECYGWIDDPELNMRDEPAGKISGLFAA